MATTTSLSDLLSLKHKTALITGAAQGIGKATAARYAEAGANLQLADVNEAQLKKTADELSTTYGVKVSTFLVDLADSVAIETFWETLSPLPDILVNNAGVFFSKKLEAIDDTNYDRTMHINTRAVIIMCREMIKRRAGRPGTMINISSIEGLRGMTYNMMLYGASKAAVCAITRALVKDYAKHGWKINTVLPGGIKTPGATAMGIAALKHFDFSVIDTSIKFALRMPAGGIGQPDDIARAVYWLGTPASDYMNGAEVAVDGGFLAV